MMLKLAIIAAYAVSLAASKMYPGDDLEALCRGRQIRLVSLSELDKLIEKKNRGMGAGCECLSALEDLKDVVDRNRHQECSMEAYENYRQYYMDYLDDSDPERARSRPKMPSSLRSFALAYGVMLSGSCRLNMINNLLHDDLRAAIRDDFEREEVKDLIGKDGPIAMALGSTDDQPDQMLLPDDFYMLLESGKRTTKKSRVSLKMVATAAMKRLKTVCERRFAPVYKQLMLPVTKLSSLGFNYRKNLLKRELKAATKEESTSDMVVKWTRVAFLCELIESVQLIQKPEDARRSAGNDATQVDVCNRHGMCDHEPPKGRDLLETIQVELDDIKPLKYKPNLQVGMNDQIYGSMRKAVAVAMVFTSFDEKKNIQLMLTKNILANIKKIATRFRVKGAYKEIKAIVNGILEAHDMKGEAKTDISTDVVTRLNDMISRQLNPETAVACGSCDKTETNPKLVWSMIAVIVIAVTVVMLAIVFKPACLVPAAG